jgi:hypothetical protein
MKLYGQTWGYLKIKFLMELGEVCMPHHTDWETFYAVSPAQKTILSHSEASQALTNRSEPHSEPFNVSQMRSRLPFSEFDPPPVLPSSLHQFSCPWPRMAPIEDTTEAPGDLSPSPPRSQRAIPICLVNFEIPSWFLLCSRLFRLSFANSIFGWYHYRLSNFLSLSS